MSIDLRMKFVCVNELPDVVNKIYLVQKGIVNEDGKVVRTVYEEWLFQPYKIGELGPKGYEKCKRGDFCIWPYKESDTNGDKP